MYVMKVIPETTRAH